MARSLAEAIAKRTVLVLVPSLALLRQTLREWGKNTTWEPFDYLCVCSAPTVSQGDDELVMRPTELEFSVSTKPEQVREFLAHSFAGVTIIFSTYQSADVVARGMPWLTNGFNDSRLRERVEVLGPTLTLDKLRRAIATRCLDRLARPWDEMVQLLALLSEISKIAVAVQRSFAIGLADYPVNSTDHLFVAQTVPSAVPTQRQKFPLTSRVLLITHEIFQGASRGKTVSLSVCLFGCGVVGWPSGRDRTNGGR